MIFFQVQKILYRLNEMIDNAMAGKPVESQFDESKVSALESKLAQYLSMNHTSKQQLEEEKARINGLISDISHQTKTPIANILLYTQLLNESTLTPQDKACVQALSQQAEKLRFLTDSLVKVSRLEAGIITVCPKKQPIEKLLQDVGVQIQGKGQEKDMLIQIARTELTACFDFRWTAEAIYNILDNAVKYSPQGSIVKVQVQGYSLFIRIDITDQGIGISEEETAKIFTQFYRSANVQEIEGVGIGLYLAREVITAQGGYIKVDAKEEKGTTFSVFLPKE